ncbi:hypothetical protein [Xanthomonas phaseoli]|uniref:DUF4345 domain-containing protein n=1 Tax=Xanthomonas manihotis TaxID=43353 RepID=A0A8I2BUG8_XANMN|nr:hypothetical protein [Xanthomonas phaseoli]KUF20810.1 hypothetical protein AO826_16325 [Xanthomonas phaseoli pv. manihotis]MBO9719044.1 DUF4345 domain-containing protein [Xanthomonas phaseoli pv. manihotis]MBO9755488.1 DUF4345 domain-containing protein [Xanthomonas phaseoli pv. manihotis]MBO9759133.1 DUF4345 domain-containing protein [Xanthomonas phaseoli pv. manihotis]MBO9762918.1 DUF4345 domain-containing protein [Xanthomonas phaseoli pv. manihotis]
MAKAYLWINAVLYFVLAVWCTLSPAKTATAVGYTHLSPAGQSEYLVIYGGLQLGMAFLFGYFAWIDQARTGLVVALAFYAPIVLFRSVSLSRLWPVSAPTVALAGVEILLLLAAVLLWFQRK